MNIVNYNAHWDPACPVMLPVGEVTIKPIVSASMGLFVPLFIFACLIFNFLSGQWLQNTGLSSKTPNNTAERAQKKSHMEPDAHGGSVYWFCTSEEGRGVPAMQFFRKGLVGIMHSNP